MLESEIYYFDSHEIEKIIDFYVEKNKAKIRDAFYLYEKYILFHHIYKKSKKTNFI